MAANLAVPMRILMPSCILLILLSAIIYPDKNSFGFYLNMTAFGLSIIFLVITILVEVPIVTQIKQWTVESIPSNWDTIRDRWLKFHLIRTFASILSFMCYSALNSYCNKTKKRSLKHRSLERVQFEVIIQITY
jgi:Domain of unknown function (DUF1772)